MIIEQHISVKNKFKVVIPARHASTRLPVKPLAMIAGQPMIWHVYQRALASAATEVVVATDHQSIFDAVTDFGGTACMTAVSHPSGTDRLAEVTTLLGWSDDEIVVNLQGDEPMMLAASIQRVASDLAEHNDAGISTLCVPITEHGCLHDPNKVKVVRDKAGYALYFSRAPIPWVRDTESASVAAPNAFLHVGLYAYRVGFLKQYVNFEPCELEQLEKLEQLRALWNGIKIYVGCSDQLPGLGVDTLDDLKKVELLLANEMSKSL